MTTTGSRRRSQSISLVTLLILALAGSSATFAQDASKPKDDALEGLLKKLGDDKSATKPDESKKVEPKESTQDTKSNPKTKSAASKLGTKSAGEVAPKDKELDSLLENLGKTEDKPSAEDKPPGGGGGEPSPDDRSAPKPDGEKRPDPGTLSGKDKDLDEHIAEISGKRRKKKDRRNDGGEAQGPLSDVIKQMRDVEKKLGDAETGEETRKEQNQIVKRLETLIEQMKSQSQQQQGKKQQGLAMKPGQKPGQPQDQPGTNGGNAPTTKPLKPETKRSILAGKDSWGHLPPEMRQEMENVFKEEPLPSREELVRRYYLSVSKKSLNRGE